MKGIKQTAKHLLPESYFQWLFPDPPELTQEEIEEILQNVENGDESKRIDANNKMIGITCNVLTSAIGGVTFQYYRDYADKHNIADDLNGQANHLLHQHTPMIIGLAICATASMAINVAQLLILNQNPRTYDIGTSIKATINNLTPTLLREAIEKIQNSDTSALQIKVPQSMNPGYKLYASYTIATAAVALSSISKDQQYLVFAASLAIAKFSINKLDEINKESTIGKSISDATEAFMLRILPSEYVLQPERGPEVPSITGKEVTDSFSTDEMDRLSSAIKSQMQKTLAKGCREDSIELFTTIANSFAFFSTVHNAPGSAMVANDHFASSLDFALGSIGYNISLALGQEIKNKGSSRVEPVTDQEFSRLDSMEQQQESSPRDEIEREEEMESIFNIDQWLKLGSKVGEAVDSKENATPSPSTTRPSSPKQSHDNDRNL